MIKNYFSSVNQKKHKNTNSAKISKGYAVDLISVIIGARKSSQGDI